MLPIGFDESEGSLMLSIARVLSKGEGAKRPKLDRGSVDPPSEKESKAKSKMVQI